ncbi:MAG: hypothetical protein IT365_02505 [Candidatus Hydrogenedentes bacterium]|nr:hypothetical protein [Candidatus Hydrogenedentota bacterium]
MPIVSSLRELDPAPRRFLYFISFNVVSWQCIVGSALVLFARSIDMPASWVGFLLSFLPLSMLLVVTTVPLVTHLGPRRLMLTAWGSRSLVICAVFIMPFAMEHWGPKSAQLVLMGATLGFCFLRAIGGGGWFPWLHEVVPDHQRGAYFSTEAALTQLLSVVVAVMQAAILQGSPSINRFLLVYSVGIAAGFISLYWMAKVPGGRGVKGKISVQSSYAAYGVALADKGFLRFVVVASLCFGTLTWLGASLVLYMRDILGYAAFSIMLIMAAGSAGILVTIRQWGRYADHAGSGSAMLLSLCGHSAAALVCLVLTPDGWWTAYLLTPAVVLASVFSAAFNMAAHRAMLNYVKSPGRIAYTNLWTVGTSLALGITPILAGICIDVWHLWGFRLCFMAAVVGGLCCAVASRITVQDGEKLDTSLAALVNPALPVRMVGRILWITLGLHESRTSGVQSSNVPPEPQGID